MARPAMPYLVTSRYAADATGLCANFRVLEAHDEAIDFFVFGVDFSALQIDSVRHGHAVDVHRGVETALGENVDEHGKGFGIMEEGVL